MISIPFVKSYRVNKPNVLEIWSRMENMTWTWPWESHTINIPFYLEVLVSNGK